MSTLLQGALHTLPYLLLMKYKHFVLYVFVTVSLIMNFSNLELFGITNTKSRSAIRVFNFFRVVQNAKRPNDVT